MCVSFQQSAFLQLITSTLPACLQSLQSIVCHRSSDQFGGGGGTWWAKWRPVAQSWWRSTWGSRPRRPPRPPRPSFCHRSACQCFCLGLGGRLKKGRKNASKMVQVSFLLSKHLTQCWIVGLLNFCGSGKFGGLVGWSTSARCLCGWDFWLVW